MENHTWFTIILYSAFGCTNVYKEKKITSIKFIQEIIHYRNKYNIRIKFYWIFLKALNPMKKTIHSILYLEFIALKYA